MKDNSVTFMTLHYSIIERLVMKVNVVWLLLLTANIVWGKFCNFLPNNYNCSVAIHAVLPKLLTLFGVQFTTSNVSDLAYAIIMSDIKI